MLDTHNFNKKYICINIVVDAYGNFLDGLITLTVSCCSVYNCVIVAICCLFFFFLCLLTLQLSPDAVTSLIKKFNRLTVSSFTRLIVVTCGDKVSLIKCGVFFPLVQTI